MFDSPLRHQSLRNFMKKLLSKRSLYFFLFYFPLSISYSWAPPLNEGEEINPTHYVAHLTIPPDEAVHLLKPHWDTKNNKGTLSKTLGVSQPTLKALVDNKKANKALKIFNTSLIENLNVWRLFSVPMQVGIILGELIRQTSLEDVATQLEIDAEKLRAFQIEPKDSEVVKNLPKISFKNWPIRGHEEATSTTEEIPATFDGRAISGDLVNVTSFRAFDVMGDQWNTLYGSSDRNPGYEPPNQTPLRIKQERHLSQFRTVIQGLNAADPNVSSERISKQLSQLSIGESPSVGPGEMYIQSPERGKELQRHVQMAEEAQRRFYTDGTASPNFLSRMGTREKLSETFAHTRPKLTVFQGSRRYPMSPYTYVHTLSTGHTVTFDRGHGCDHADTLEHGGILSTCDPNNYVPQNWYYNEHIRNPLVARIRNGGGSYKEFSLYHHSPYMTNDVRIPEAFIFVELYDGKPKSAYFFPNLVAYEYLKFENRHKSKYLDYLDLFRINALIEYFFNPVVQTQDPIPHMEQRNRASIISWRIPLDITILFNNMTEHAFPSRARATLIRSVMDQNINTAAILDFDSLLSIETAINHYGNDRIYWELDDRSEEERVAAFTTHLSELSQPIIDAVNLVKVEFPKVYADQRVFRRIITQVFGQLINTVRPSDQKTMRKIIGGHSIKSIDLARRYLHLALNRIDQEVFTDRELNGIQRTLTYIPELEDPKKATELDRLYKDPNMRRRKIDGELVGVSSPMIRAGIGPSEAEQLEGIFRDHVLNNILKHDVGEVKAGNFSFETLFELLLIFEEERCEDEEARHEAVYSHLMSLDLLDTTLEEKKLLADFFWKAGDQDKKEVWIDKIKDHFNKKPNQKNTLLLSSWLRSGIGCLEKNEKDAQQVDTLGDEYVQRKARKRESLNRLMMGQTNFMDGWRTLLPSDSSETQ